MIARDHISAGVGVRAEVKEHLLPVLNVDRVIDRDNKISVTCLPHRLNRRDSLSRLGLAERNKDASPATERRGRRVDDIGPSDDFVQFHSKL